MKNFFHFRKNILCFLLVFLTFNAFSLEVARDELENVNENQTIVFKNYTGPQNIIQTKNQIAGIGQHIGSIISNAMEMNSTFSYSPNYKIIHAVSNEDSGKLDADILLLGENAGVDHIKNLRLIISSYLESCYGYSAEDAQTLAVFITVYNAVYRGDLDSISVKYKDSVLKYLVKEKLGLSVNYEEWPGKTQILIPLFELRGGLSTIDTSLISDSQVVNSMREDDDKGVDVRKNMNDLKEREAENAFEEASVAQKNYTAEKENLAQQEKVVNEENQKLTELEKELESENQKLQENPNDKEAQEKVSETEKLISEQQKVVQQEQEKLDESKAKTEEYAQTAQEKQAFADKKQSEAYNERGEIAKDQEAVISKQNEDAMVKNASFVLKIVDSNAKTASLAKIDSESGRIIQESSMDVIRGRTFFSQTDGFVCIAGKNVKNGAIKLVLLDKESLEMVNSSQELIYEDSVLLFENGFYYAVINDNGEYKVAKFDNSLKMQCATNFAVNPATPITPISGTFALTDTKGKIVVVDSSLVAR